MVTTGSGCPTALPEVQAKRLASPPRSQLEQILFISRYRLFSQTSGARLCGKAHQVEVQGRESLAMKTAALAGMAVSIGIVVHMFISA